VNLKSSKAIRPLLALLALLALGPASGHAGNVALGVKAGTLGIGGELTIGLAPPLNLRLGVSGLNYTYDDTYDDVDYDLDADLLSAGLLLDWHPFSGSFRLTAGVLFNDSQADLSARDPDGYTINDEHYSTAAVGRLSGSMDFADLAPYVGIGWGNAIGEGGRITVGLDLGLMYQGDPDVSLQASGPIRNNPRFRADLQAEEEEIEDDTFWLKYYPVIGLSIGYRF
jgi:hypothetical protein